MEDTVYRSCVSILVFRKGDPKERFLILHKPRRRDAWQLPQGGVEEGETPQQAVLRELNEEAGISAKIICESGIVYQYDFSASFRRFRRDSVRGQRIIFFLAETEPDAKIEVDRKEIDAFAWVGKGDLGKYVKRKEYLEVVKKLVDEVQDKWMENG